MSGSEGGGIEANRCFLPLYLLAKHTCRSDIGAQPRMAAKRKRRGWLLCAKLAVNFAISIWCEPASP